MTSALSNRPDYLQAIGSIDAEWATIEHASFLIFQAMMGVDAPRAHAVFAHLSNHRLRQDVVNSVAKVVLAGRPELQRIRSLEKRLERVALKRNILAHAVWGVRGKDVFILDQRRNWRPVQVTLDELIELQTTLRELYNDIIQFLKVLRAEMPQIDRPAAADDGAVVDGAVPTPLTPTLPVS